MSRPIERFISKEFNAKSTPIKSGTTDGILRYLDTSGQGAEEDDNAEKVTDLCNIAGRVRDAWVDKYGDDISTDEHQKFDTGERFISTTKESCKIHASTCEENFNLIRRNAEMIGMRVNHKKTQLVCISPNNNMDVSSFIEIDGLKIESQDSLNLLGFVIGRDGSMAGQVG